MYKLYNDNSLNVLDTFADNSIAALNKNRNHIGIELSEQYYEESLKRFTTINSQKTNNCKKISS